MHRLVNTSISCGVRELVGLRNSTPREKVKHVAHNLLNLGHNFSTVIFSDGTHHGAGQELANWITRNRVGELHETGNHINPNSRRTINVWMWKLPDRDRMQRYIPTGRDPIREWEANDMRYRVETEYG